MIDIDYNDLVGTRINNVEVLEFAGFRYDINHHKRSYYKVKCCKCGKIYEMDRYMIINQNPIACKICAHIKHGESKTRLYKIWMGMKNRCQNINSPDYINYGARGIYICPEWNGENNFINFKNWALNNGYDDNLTIDRIDVDGPYSPSNCRWATIKEQNWNKTTNVRINIGSESLTCLDLCKKLNLTINVRDLSQRLSPNNTEKYKDWSLNDKLYVTPGQRKDDYRKQHNITNPIIYLEK